MVRVLRYAEQPQDVCISRRECADAYDLPLRSEAACYNISLKVSVSSGSRLWLRGGNEDLWHFVPVFRRVWLYRRLLRGGYALSGRNFLMGYLVAFFSRLVT